MGVIGFLYKFNNDLEFRTKQINHLKTISAVGNVKASLAETQIKKKQTLKSINHQQGSKNSMYGKRWIYSNELEASKRILKNDPLPHGWHEGRKLKF